MCWPYVQAKGIRSLLGLIGIGFNVLFLWVVPGWVVGTMLIAAIRELRDKPNNPES